MKHFEESKTDEQRVQAFFDEACVRLGFCLSSDIRMTLSKRDDLTPHELVKEVLSADGFNPRYSEGEEFIKPLLKLYQKHLPQISI